MEQTIAPKLSAIADGGVASPAGIHAGGIHAGGRELHLAAGGVELVVGAQGGVVELAVLVLIEVDAPLHEPSPRTSSAPRP